MAAPAVDGKTVFKLAIWSLVVGFILYSLRLSPGDIYGWLLDTMASFWQWLMDYGFQYMLLGAAIVVPIYLFNLFRGKKK